VVQFGKCGWFFAYDKIKLLFLYSTVQLYFLLLDYGLKTPKLPCMGLSFSKIFSTWEV
jgi:hypothetical protein